MNDVTMSSLGIATPADRLGLAIKNVVRLTPRDVKSLYGMTTHLMQEVGELAECVEVHEGHRDKALKEPIEGEVADVVQCAIAILARVYPGLTGDALLGVLAKSLNLKNAKWEAAMNRSATKPAPAVVPKVSLAEAMGLNTAAPRTLSSRVIAVKGKPVIDFNSIPMVKVLIRKHPAGITQPTGERRVFKVERTPGTNRVWIGLGPDGKQGWDLDITKRTPSFLTFRVAGSKSPATLQEAVEFWERSSR